jgi:hypothetical protein
MEKGNQIGIPELKLSEICPAIDITPSTKLMTLFNWRRIGRVPGAHPQSETPSSWSSASVAGDDQENSEIRAP